MIAITHVGIRTVFFSGLWLFVIIAFFHVFYREDLTSSSGQTDSLLDTQQQFKEVEVRVHKEFNIDPEERFLAYFAHSGFHNQRVALENALLLAKILNRTLLMPPILFGPPIPWARFDKLYEKLLVSTKMGLEHCWKIPDQIPLPAECLNYFSSTAVSWDFLFDMEPIREWHKIVDRWEPSYGWLSQNLRVSLDEDFHFIKDTTLFDYRIHDSSFGSPQNVKYKRKLDIKELEEIDKKVLHLGSLFGLHRVMVEKPDSVEHAKFIEKHLIPHNTIIQNAADSIVEQLGGIGNFIGLHIRVSDGFFVTTARENVDTIYRRIVKSNTNLTLEDLNILEGDTHDQDTLMGGSIHDNETKVNRHLEERGYSNDRVQCRKSLHPTNAGINTVMFMATDARSPRRNPLLYKFFSTFPCIFVLDDFEKELAEIKSLRNAEDKTPLSGYLINILDAVVSSKGREFYGTPRSTFSNYIEKVLHPTYTGSR